MDRPERARVRRAFDRAAGSYDGAALVQRRICDRLADTLPPLADAPTVLDAGCGTGYAHAALQQRYPGARLVALDLAEAMLQRVPGPALRLAGDIERLPLAAASVDLYWSSLAVQWCDLPRTLREARRVLRPAGALRIATLGEATFHELRDAFAGLDRYDHTLAFSHPDDIARQAAATWQDVEVTRRTEVLHYPDFSTLLRAVKAVGANQLGAGRRPGLAGRAGFRAAEARYEARRTGAGLPLTYDVITLSARP